MNYTVQRFTIHRETVEDTDVQDITDDVVQCIRDSGVHEGSCLVFVAGATASITTMEFESGCVADLTRCLESLAPSRKHYEHNARWGDGNDYSHVRAALMKPGITVPVASGAPMLGTWQQIVLLDFDNRPRRREVVVQVSGSTG